MRNIKAGSTDVTIYLQIVDSTDGTPETGVVYDTAGIAISYVRNQAAAASITLADLAATNSAHADGGFKHLGYGTYRLDLPDAAVAAGVDTVDIIGTVTGMVVLPVSLQLVGYDPRSELTTAVLARIDENVSAEKSLVDGAITAAKIATDAITSSKIANDALTAAKFAAGAFDAVWERLTAALTTADTIGKLLVDNINATISSRAAPGAAMDLVAGAVDADAVAADAIDASALATDAITEIAAAVWNRLTSALDAVGSVGEMLVARIDAAISSRAATGAAMTLAAGAVNAAAIGNGAIDADAIAADAITSAKIADGTLTDAKFAADMDSYQAKVELFDDDNGEVDRYVAIFYKNSQPVTSGITNPQLQVIKVSDGTDLIAAAAMTEIGALGLYRYSESDDRITGGVAYIAKVSATIDGSARVWYQPVGRDSVAA